MPELLRAATREYRSVIMDSHRWDGYQPRADDIIVATYPKCGTTWTQRIVDLLVFQSPDPRPFGRTSPWLDAKIFATIEQDLATLDAQTHRRFIKTHLPYDSVPIYEGVKMIHVARDGRDACMSMHNHMRGFRPEIVAAIAAAAMADGTATERPPETPEDPRDYYLQWIAEAQRGARPDDVPFFEFENTYWSRRTLPDLLFVHFNDLKADLAGEIRRIADFLGIDTPESLLPDLARAASFETMKSQAGEMLPELSMAFDHGADRFINKGTNGRWKDVLSEADLEPYHALVRARFTPAEARWIEHGRLVAGDPRELPD
ncbi:MAG: sulfotransferase domain-containing protein [Caulobacterales bacterium]